MAIQNFLSGGYYGKLGATVGQRWKNKRTIRTYVVPANPRTEAQQANRGKFANAVVFAQMGLQMNYYATLFEDPNFTRWNYRMKVARELKKQGLSDLDLIPLYPISFVPQTLIQNIKISSVQGTKHITFEVQGLTSNIDRVLSLMFAIYNENDTFLGYKLYIGYYYASNPNYLEVDVDDVLEINKHCYVRVVSNDDVDSATDMIASPKLQVEVDEIDIRAFNTSIKEVQKSLAGITVIFDEIWKGDPTKNNISIIASFVSNGKKTNAHVTDATLENNNGYCSVSIPFIVSDNQNLPAFPEGSEFIVSSVAYEGSTWKYTKENDTVAYNDTDLNRNIAFNPSWDAQSGSDISFTIPFGGTVASANSNMSMICSGRFDERGETTQTFSYVGNGSNLTFTCTGDLKNYPMSTSGDKITVPQLQFTCNGVTYTLAGGNVNLRNAIKISSWLNNNRITRDFQKDIITGSPNKLMTLWAQISGLVINEDIIESVNWVKNVATVNSETITPYSQEVTVDGVGTAEAVIVINASFNEEDNKNAINDTCTVAYSSSNNTFTYKGINYIMPASPTTLADFTTL